MSEWTDGIDGARQIRVAEEAEASDRYDAAVRKALGRFDMAREFGEVTMASHLAHDVMWASEQRSEAWNGSWERFVKCYDKEGI